MLLFWGDPALAIGPALKPSRSLQGENSIVFRLFLFITFPLPFFRPNLTPLTCNKSHQILHAGPVSKTELTLASDLYLTSKCSLRLQHLTTGKQRGALLPQKHPVSLTHLNLNTWFRFISSSLETTILCTELCGVNTWLSCCSSFCLFIYSSFFFSNAHIYDGCCHLEGGTAIIKKPTSLSNEGL